jgi:hypothetical protein
MGSGKSMKVVRLILKHQTTLSSYYGINRKINKDQLDTLLEQRPVSLHITKSNMQ